MSYSKIKSYAKINSALNIVGKKNSMHKIESIVSFLYLHDEILIKKIKNKDHRIKFFGKFSSNIKSDNTVSQLFKIIDKKKLLKDKYQIIIKKNIPSKINITHINLNDDTIAGISCPELNAFSIQYHPESCPGPNDSQYLFDNFINNIKKINE